MSNAKKRVDAAFEFFDKLGVKYYAFHDIDIAPEGETLAETEKIFHEVRRHRRLPLTAVPDSQARPSRRLRIMPWSTRRAQVSDFCGPRRTSSPTPAS